VPTVIIELGASSGLVTKFENILVSTLPFVLFVLLKARVHAGLL